MVTPFYARDATIKVALESAITIGTTGNVFDYAGFATAVEGYAKNVTITPPEGPIEQIDLLGDDSNSFQNAAADIKPYGMATISGTLVHPGDELLEPFVMGAGASTVISGSYTRWQVGKGSRVSVALVVNFDNGTDEVSVLFDNGWFTKFGEKSLNADGHWEQNFELVCHARDYYEEYKN